MGVPVHTDRGHVVVVAKGLMDGKSRLASHLGSEARYAFNLRSLERTVRAAVEFFGQHQCTLVSPCLLTCGTARRMGVRVVFQERDDGLNRGLDLARDSVRAQGARTLTVLPVDLPYVSNATLRAALGMSIGPGLSAIVPDTALQGTNLLSIPADMPFEFQFGPSSFVLHLDQLRRRCVHVRVVQPSSLQEDIDTVEQLHRFISASTLQLASAPVPCQTQNFHDRRPL